MSRDYRDDPAKEFLYSVIEARMELRRIKRKTERLRSQAEHITATLTGMPRSGGGDREKVLIALAETRAEYLPKLAAAEQRELEVEQFIDALPGKENRMVLRLRYIENKRWPAVVRGLEKAGLPYSERQVYRIHGTALNEARKYWNTTHKTEGELDT